MKKMLKKMLAVSVMSCGIAAAAGAAEPPMPPAPTPKCPKCGCEMMPGRGPAMDRPMPGPGDMKPDRRNFAKPHGMRRAPFDVKDLSEAELAKFLTLGKNVRQSMMAYQKEKTDVNRAALEKAVKELTAFTQAQKIKTLEKKLAEAKADNARIDELAKKETDRLLKRSAEREMRRQQRGRGPEGPRPEGPRPEEGPEPRQ